MNEPGLAGDDHPMVVMDALMPSQYVDMHTHIELNGDPKLYVGVVIRALKDLTSTNRKIRADAHHWLMSEEDRHIFSFRAVCDFFDEDPAKVRERILEIIVDLKQPLRIRTTQVRNTGEALTTNKWKYAA